MDNNDNHFMLSDDAAYEKTMFGALGMRIIECTGERVVGTMPVGPSTWQYFGVLHGGASVALAETVASVGTYNLIDKENQLAVGMEINANHIRSKRDGMVTAVATPLHKGRTTMVWDIKITDEEDRLICVSRCTVGIIPKVRESR
ncbi:hotdog fold thioesterase [Paenibacillus glycanilyticus]|uniref:hotdog fold thioesterase n=1 Tax=Paenibacillus glycanilyticus TaxID=126569 RepID=UPI00203B87BC|nr:hotdog fold thioesterase [Paenibacillus glycanilyticus]MCM3627743.1 hotdog fold thioesterase [Paenibacillus glycanilyticus]